MNAQNTILIVKILHFWIGQEQEQKQEQEQEEEEEEVQEQKQQAYGKFQMNGLF